MHIPLSSLSWIVKMKDQASGFLSNERFMNHQNIVIINNNALVLTRSEEC
jgi:hypothetical protein